MELIRRQGSARIVIDFSNVEFADSSFIAGLVTARKQLSGTEGFLKLACLSKNIRSLLKMLRLDGVFQIYSSVNRAVYHFITNNRSVNHKIIVTLPGEMKYIHFISDSARALIQHHYDHPNPQEMEKVIHEVQVLIYELFSNCVKHSNSNVVKFLFELHPFYFYVKTITTGNGFFIKPVDRDTLTGQGDVLIPPPYGPEVIGSDYIVYQDNVNEVICHVESPYSVSLSRRSNPQRDQGEFEVPEHYGLLLITELSSEASWQRNENEDVFAIRKDIMT
ncbi:MAG: hypothetical protein AMXMBFR48_29930 [Ignavibacteriales bacterium]